MLAERHVQHVRLRAAQLDSYAEAVREQLGRLEAGQDLGQLRADLLALVDRGAALLVALEAADG